MNILLQGFSGCQIRIEPRGTLHQVIKSTANPAYAPRLLLQAEKQKTYGTRALPAMFRVPSIHELVAKNDAAAIHMEYSHGLDIISYLSMAGQEDIAWLQESLAALIDLFCAASPIVDVARTTLQDKLAQTLQKIDASASHRAAIQPLAKQIEQRFSQLPAMLSLPVGQCHGDLTLSNVLIDPLEPHIVLIDFLDSFIETPLMDMVKLRQDTAHAWSCSIYGAPYPSERLQSVMQQMDAFFDTHFRRYDAYKNYYSQFQLLSLLRILPYITEERLIQTIATAVAQELER